jgi:hypothetical protein
MLEFLAVTSRRNRRSCSETASFGCYIGIARPNVNPRILEYQLKFGMEDLLNSLTRSIYPKLMIDRTPSGRFSSITTSTTKDGVLVGFVLRESIG